MSSAFALEQPSSLTQRPTSSPRPLNLDVHLDLPYDPELEIHDHPADAGREPRYGARASGSGHGRLPPGHGTRFGRASRRELEADPARFLRSGQSLARLSSTEATRPTRACWGF